MMSLAPARLEKTASDSPETRLLKCSLSAEETKTTPNCSSHNPLSLLLLLSLHAITLLRSMINLVYAIREPVRVMSTTGSAIQNRVRDAREIRRSHRLEMLRLRKKRLVKESQHCSSWFLHMARQIQHQCCMKQYGLHKILTRPSSSSFNPLLQT
ncbi:unnamed protein product [Arabidopsis halleri]